MATSINTDYACNPPARIGFGRIARQLEIRSRRLRRNAKNDINRALRTPNNMNMLPLLNMSNPEYCTSEIARLGTSRPCAPFGKKAGSMALPVIRVPQKHSGELSTLFELSCWGVMGIFKPHDDRVVRVARIE